MKFLHLSADAFLALRTVSINLDNRGLILIQGDNQDDTSANSNGAGKSSVGDALCWCLFGVTARGVKGDAVINRNDKPGATGVKLWIEVNGEKYSIDRYRKHKKYKNRLMLWKEDATNPGEWNDLTAGTDKLTQQKVDQLLGCSYEVFRAAVYSAQEDVQDIPGMTDRQLKLLIEEAAGTHVLEKAYELSRKILSEEKETLNSIENQFEACEQRLKDEQERLDRDQARYDDWAVRHDHRKQQMAEDIEVLEHKTGSLAGCLMPADDFDQLERDIAAAKTRIDHSDAERQEERRLEDAMISYGKNIPSHKMRLKGMVDQIRDLKKKIEHLEGDAKPNCDACGHELDQPGLEKRLKDLKEKRSEVAGDARAVKHTLENLIKHEKTCADALEKFRASMTDVSEETALYERLNEKREGEREKINKLDNLRHELNGLMKQYSDLRAEENPFASNIKNSQDRTEGLAAKQSGLRDERKLARDKISIAEQVRDVYSPKGVRAHILDHVTPFLNDRTARYLGTLSDGNISAEWSTLTVNKSGDLSERFTIDVSNDTGADNYAGLSGGEKRKVRLGCMLALQDLVASRAANPIPLWIGDEIDDALDASGLERLMSILDEKARERGSVFVISHNDLKDWIRETIVITKKDGLSMAA